MDEQQTKKKMKYLELNDLKVDRGEGRSPAELFMALNESEIARQLCLIEFKIFSKIKVILLLLILIILIIMNDMIIS